MTTKEKKEQTDTKGAKNMAFVIGEGDIFAISLKNIYENTEKDGKNVFLEKFGGYITEENGTYALYDSNDRPVCRDMEECNIENIDDKNHLAVIKGKTSFTLTKKEFDLAFFGDGKNMEKYSDERSI